MSEAQKLVDGLPPEIQEEAQRLGELQNELMNNLRYRAVNMLQAVEAIQQVNYPRASILLLQSGTETEAKIVHDFYEQHGETIISLGEKVQKILKQSPEEFDNKVTKARVADIEQALRKFK
tara:strand:+ start:5852 stop:6214 length:363 start_codon:yes stop_codon:yes gene_type:complete